MTQYYYLNGNHYRMISYKELLKAESLQCKELSLQIEFLLDLKEDIIKLHDNSKEEGRRDEHLLAMIDYVTEINTRLYKENATITVDSIEFAKLITDYITDDEKVNDKKNKGVSDLNYYTKKLQLMRAKSFMEHNFGYCL